MSKQAHKAIGDTLTFVDPDGKSHTGTISARDWSFSTLPAYVVTLASGRRYRVNATEFRSGHSF